MLVMFGLSVQHRYDGNWFGIEDKLSLFPSFTVYRSCRNVFLQYIEAFRMAIPAGSSFLGRVRVSFSFGVHRQ